MTSRERFLITLRTGGGASTLRRRVEEGCEVVTFDLGEDPRRLRLVLDPAQAAQVTRSGATSRISTRDRCQHEGRQLMELGIISSIWFDTPVGRLEGIKRAKEIGFDTYDIFEDPLDITDAERAEIKAACEEVGLPIRSVVCVAFGIVDFNPSVRRFTLDRIKGYVDQGAYFGARNVLLVVGEYYWDGEVFPRSAIWDMAKDMIREAGEYAHSKGLEIVLELEPFTEALLKDVHELSRFVREVEHPAVRANADISHLHLSDCSFEDVALLRGLIGHIHLSDCDGKVHGDMPAGMGVTPIREYLAAIRDTGYDGTVSIELEYAPNPDEIVAWAQKAYDGTAAIMAELGVRS